MRISDWSSDVCSSDLADKPSLASVSAARRGGARALVAHADKGGAFAWAVMSQTLAYAASLVPEIADDIPSVDRAMRLGYNWKHGPFELLDQLGADDVAERLMEEGLAVPLLLPQAAEAGSFYRELGRASGRERVCKVGGIP